MIPIQNLKYPHVSDHTNHIFSESSWSKDIPAGGEFLKRGLLRGIKNDIHKCQTRKSKYTYIQVYKYTNTAYDEVPERPNMWYIFEKRIVQGYQTLYSHVPNAQIQKYKYKNTQIHKYKNT